MLASVLNTPLLLEDSSTIIFNNIVKKILNKNTNSQSESNDSYKYENITTKKLIAQQRKPTKKIKME